MSKIVLPDASPGNSGWNRVNDNFRKIEEEFQDKVLYRDNPSGEPNEMENDLDMNSNHIYNLPEPVADHEPARWGDVKGGVPAAKEWAEISRQWAETSREWAEDSREWSEVSREWAEQSQASAEESESQADRAEDEADRAEDAADSVAGVIGRIDALEADKVNKIDLSNNSSSAQGSALVGHLPLYGAMYPKRVRDKINAQVVTPFDFIDGPTPSSTSSADYSDVLQAAVNFVFGGTVSTPRILDLAGRNWRIDKPIVYSSAPAASSIIQNGRITCTSAYSGGPMFDFRQPTQGSAGTGSGFTIRNVQFNGGGTSAGQNYAPGAIWMYNTFGVFIMDCRFQFFNGHVIYDATTRAAAEVVIQNCKIFNRDRAGDGIRLMGTDGEVRGCIISGCDTGIHIGGSNGVFNNHPYSCNTAIQDDSAFGQIVGNYIDACPLRIKIPSVMGKMVCNNKFLAPTFGDYTEGGYIVAEPDGANRVIRNLVITGNVFYGGGGGVLSLTAVNTANGTLAGLSNGLIMKDNVVGTDNPVQTSFPTARGSVSPGTTVTVDLTNILPFGLRPYSVSATFQRSAGSSAEPYVYTLSPTDKTVTANLSVNATGVVLFQADTNNPSL